MSDSAHSGSVASLSLATLLIDLLNEHVAKEAAFSEAMRDYAETVAARSDEEAGDPPTWEQTNWDKAIILLYTQSKFFHGTGPSDSVYEDPCDIYERLLRSYLTALKRGKPIQSNPAAAELLDFGRNGIGEELQRQFGTGHSAKSTGVSPSHSLDFRSVNWFGQLYSFTENQAAAVRVLWRAWENKTPEVGGETLLQAADANTLRIDVVFRSNLAWGTMIVRGRTKGSYRLNETIADSPKRPKRAAKKTSARARK